MSGNVVKAFVATGTITKGAKSIVLGIATQTSDWNRPESVVTEDTKDGFKAAVESDTKELPAKAEKVVMRFVSNLQKTMNADLTFHTASQNTAKTIITPQSSLMIMTTISSLATTKVERGGNAGEQSKSFWKLTMEGFLFVLYSRQMTGSLQS